MGIILCLANPSISLSGILAIVSSNQNFLLILKAVNLFNNLLFLSIPP